MVGVLITVFVLKEALPALQSIGVQRFFSDEAWYPLEGQFNLIPILLGTVLTAFGSIAIAMACGVPIAVRQCSLLGRNLCSRGPVPAGIPLSRSATSAALRSVKMIR